MTGSLEIRDGAVHWWLSPDIWVVPGSDPDGPPSTPVVGNPAYVWARVRNNGSSAVIGARVDFWWADPSAQILRSNANVIGSAFVDVNPGEEQEALCLTPWNVQLVNGGHECLLAEVTYPASSVPFPPPDDFGPTTYVEIAQRNITVASMATLSMPLMVALGATGRRSKRVMVTSKTGGELDKTVLAQLGLPHVKPAKKASLKVQLAKKCSSKPEGKERLEMKLEPCQRAGVYVHISAQGIERKEYALVHIIENQDGKDIGGCSILVVNSDK